MNSTLSPEIQTLISKYRPYFREIRRKLLSLAILFLTSGLLGFVYYQKIISLLMKLFNLKDVNLVMTNPYQVFTLALKVGLLTGLLTIAPLFLYHLLKFLRPGLKTHEFRLLLSLIPLSLLLFSVGVSFGVFIMYYIIILFARTTSDFAIGNLWDVDVFLSQVIFTAASLGFIFQFPLILTALMRLKIIKRQLLVNKRRHAYVACVVFAAVLPTTDAFSLLIMTAPLLFLYELTLLFNPVQ